MSVRTQPLKKELLDSQPPCDLESERAVIGSMLLDRNCIDDVAMLLTSGDFYSEANRKLFSHLKAIHDSGRGVDERLLVARLEKAGELAAVDGIPYIAECVVAVPNAHHATYYAQLVQDASTWRRLIDAGSRIVQAGYGRHGEPSEALQAAEREVFSIQEDRIAGDAKPVSEVLAEVLLAVERGDAIRGLDCGFSDLNATMGGLRDSELIILAARPGMGKTALALNIADRLMRRGDPVLFFSLEMSSEELGLRLSCCRAKVSLHSARNNYLKTYERQSLMEAMGGMSKEPLDVDDTPARNTSEIASVARRMKRRRGTKLIIVDYLQLVEPDDRRAPREQQVAAMTRRFKALARELNIPVLLVAQLNRQADTESAKPKLSHLRESGAIEQDANIVLFVHRVGYFNDAADQTDCDVVIAKNRGGPVGEVKLRWFGPHVRFENAVSDRGGGWGGGVAKAENF